MSKLARTLTGYYVGVLVVLAILNDSVARGCTTPV
jgi:hypothetical protein